MERRADGEEELVIRQAEAPGRQHREDEAVVRGELAERLPADAVHVVLEVRIGETLENLFDIGEMGVVVEAELPHQSLAALLHHGLDDGEHGRVGDALADGAEPLHLADVRGRGMSGVEGEELPFDIGLEVVHRGHARNRGNRPDEGAPFYVPLEVFFDGDVQRNFAAHGRHDAVHGRIRPADVLLRPCGDIGT